MEKEYKLSVLLKDFMDWTDILTFASLYACCEEEQGSMPGGSFHILDA